VKSKATFSSQVIVEYVGERANFIYIDNLMYIDIEKNHLFPSRKGEIGLWFAPTPVVELKSMK
jgi:hypothetical protein